jgi:hypothetical protein
MGPRKVSQKLASPFLVFVSHATADKWIACRICDAFDAIPGVETFRDDRDIEGGENIPQVIGKKLAEANMLVVLLTPNSYQRQWVLIEIGAFWGKMEGQTILPVTYVVKDDQVPEMLKQHKYVSLNDIDQFVTQLKSRLERGEP